MTFTLGHCNIQQTDSASNELRTIGAVASKCDVATWNEARDAKNSIGALNEFDSYVRGGIGISWRVERFECIGKGIRYVMKGGRHRGRRLGPTRYVMWALLEEKATGRKVIIATHHSIAKADTDNKWRRPFRAAGWAKAVTELRAVQKRHPGVPLVFDGDWNTIGKVTAFAALGLREVKTPTTFGKRLRYDRIHANTGVSNVRTLTTRSDHKALLATVTLGGAATPPDPPKPPPVEEPTVATSQNGYIANDRSRVESITIPGTSRKVTLRKGAPGQLLAHFAGWFDRVIESVDGGQLDDWGYAERPIRGSKNTLSNHASGTALDLNAPRHPLGARNTFTPGQMSRIRAKLKEYDGAIRWGGDYRNRADEMHFEIMASPEKCARVLKAVSQPAEPPEPEENRVQRARESIREHLAGIDEAIKLLREARSKDGKPRPAVQREADSHVKANAAHRAALTKGPSK